MQYQDWMEEGKKDIVRRALGTVVREGMSVPHHFYITFRTQFPGVNLPDFLNTQYPEEMTIVLNDAFWNLTVNTDSFSVDLLFEHKKSTLRIPYAALMSFIDPGVEFALQFNWEAAEPLLITNNIIFLDKFRKPLAP